MDKYNFEAEFLLDENSIKLLKDLKHKKVDFFKIKSHVHIPGKADKILVKSNAGNVKISTDITDIRTPWGEPDEYLHFNITAINREVLVNEKISFDDEIERIFIVRDEVWWSFGDVELSWSAPEKYFCHVKSDIAIEFWGKRYCITATIYDSLFCMIDVGIFDSMHEENPELGLNAWMYKTSMPDKFIRTRIEI